MKLLSNNFVIISLSPWDFPYGSNIRDIALELSGEYQVLYVNIPLKRTELSKKDMPGMAIRKEAIKSKSNKLEVINDNLRVLTTPAVLEPINRVKPNALFDKLNKVNNKRYAKSILNTIKDLGWESYYFINDNDFYSGFYLYDLLNPVKSVYYLRDYMRGNKYWKTHSHRIEPMLIKNYDVICANSLYLANYASEFNKNAHYVGQGCDVEHFIRRPKNLKEPDDLKPLKGRKIGYIGALTSVRLDPELIEKIAEHYKNDSIILVGPQDPVFEESSLHQIDNVYFLGLKDFNEINVYMYNFDVCINPQMINGSTIGNYPRKVDEYLATGTPVVATFTESMIPFESVVYLAKDADEFIEKIEVAISENNKQKEEARKKFSESHTWPNSVNEMLKKLI